MKNLLFSFIITIYVAPSFCYEILSLSDAILDFSIQIKEEEIESFDLKRNDWIPIPFETAKTYQNLFPKITPHAGGSGANLLRGLATLGEQCSLVGRIGKDLLSEEFHISLNKINIKSHLCPVSEKTACAFCFITPEGQRLMRTYLGNYSNITDLQLDPEIFEKIDWFHLEGYQLPYVSLCEKALKLAKSNHAITSLDLANEFLTKKYKNVILSWLPKYIDVVFANELEAKTLFGLKPEQACKKLSQLCKIAVVTCGACGSFISSQNKTIHIPAMNVKPLDTTGAGDFYASGIIYGILHDLSLYESGQIATILASNIIQVIGTSLSPIQTKHILSEVKSLPITEKILTKD